MLGGHQFYLVFFFLFLQISAAVAVGPYVVAALAMVMDLAEVSLLAETALILGGGGLVGITREGCGSNLRVHFMLICLQWAG